MVAISIGVGLLYGRNVIPPFWSIAIANALILVGHALLVAGASHHQHRYGASGISRCLDDCARQPLSAT
ncbi:hypothetical protein HALO156_40007 [Halomonas sp. 156]|nr:hypothetical protein HALO156_40007 [Halomonas sp. 156]